MISIYLDDQRTPIEAPSENSEWVIVRSYDEFADLVEKTGLDNIEIISFDHDLDRSATLHYINHVRIHYRIDYSKIEKPTGLDAVKWMISHAEKTGTDIPKCYVHSANPIGSGNIIGYVNLYLKNCKRPEDCIRTRWNYEINGKIFEK